MKLLVTTGSCIWAGIFSLLFMLSQDHWFPWHDPVQLGPLNFPLRIYYFVFLQFLLAVLLGVFLAGRSKREPDDPDRGH